MCTTLNQVVKAKVEHLRYGKLVDARTGRLMPKVRDFGVGALFQQANGVPALVCKAPRTDQLYRVYPNGTGTRWVPLEFNTLTRQFVERRDLPGFQLLPALAKHLRNGRYFDADGEMVRLRVSPGEVVFANSRGNGHVVVVRVHYKTGQACRMVEDGGGRQQFFPLGWLAVNTSFVELPGAKPILSLSRRNPEPRFRSNTQRPSPPGHPMHHFTGRSPHAAPRFQYRRSRFQTSSIPRW